MNDKPHSRTTSGTLATVALVLGSALLAGGILHTDLPERLRQCAGRLTKSAMESIERESYANQLTPSSIQPSEWVWGDR